MCHYILIIFVAILPIISLGNMEHFSGSNVSPLQQTHSIFNKAEVEDYIVNCVGIKRNDCFFNQHTMNKASSDTVDIISSSAHFCRRQ